MTQEINLYYAWSEELETSVNSLAKLALLDKL